MFGSSYSPPIKKLSVNSFIQKLNYFAGLEGSGGDGEKNHGFPCLETFTNKRLNYDWNSIGCKSVNYNYFCPSVYPTNIKVYCVSGTVVMQ